MNCEIRIHFTTILNIPFVQLLEEDNRALAGHEEWKADKGPQLDKYSKRDDGFLGGKKLLEEDNRGLAGHSEWKADKGISMERTTGHDASFLGKKVVYHGE